MAANSSRRRASKIMRNYGVAVAYQHPALAPDLTVLENIKLFRARCSRIEAS